MGEEPGEMASYGKEYFLWMVEEIGESIAVLKKKGGNAVMEERKSGRRLWKSSAMF